MKLSLAITSLVVTSVTAFTPALNNVVTRPQTSSLAMSEPERDNMQDSNEMSKALPFVKRPKMLDGTLAGDVGFE
jgi:hypothetical protein